MSAAIPTQNSVVIERHFDAPIETIWNTWTDPEEFSAWYGPPGACVAVSVWEAKVGGKRLVRMTMPTPNGEMTMWFAGEFLEVTRNERLVYTEFVADEHGQPTTDSPVGGPASHPVTEVRVELTDTGGGTKMVMTHLGIPAGSPGAAGWTMAFRKLAAHLQASRA